MRGTYLNKSKAQLLVLLKGGVGLSLVQVLAVDVDILFV